MERILKAIAIWFFLEVGLPCLYFAVTEGIDSAIAYAEITLVIFALSTPFVILSLPLWMKARKLLDEKSQD
jgi:hypothetical protein